MDSEQNQNQNQDPKVTTEELAQEVEMEEEVVMESEDDIMEEDVVVAEEEKDLEKDLEFFNQEKNEQVPRRTRGKVIDWSKADHEELLEDEEDEEYEGAVAVEE